MNKMRAKRAPRCTKILAICHGESELEIIKSLKMHLRISIEAYRDANTSIQLTSLKKHLSNTVFKDEGSLVSYYSKLKSDDGHVSSELRIFIIVDTDDCHDGKNDYLEQVYKSGEMFKDHWARNRIVPIYNTPNLDEVFRELGYEIDYRSKVNSYRSILSQAATGPSFWIELADLLDQQSSMTNLGEFIRYCLYVCENDTK